MTNYFNFLKKQTLKNPFISLSLFLLFIFILLFWIYNFFIAEDPFLAQMKINQQKTLETIQVFQREDAGEVQEKKALLAQIKTAEFAYKQKDYTLAYDTALKINQLDSTLMLNSPQANETTLLWQKLSKLNLPMEKPGQEKQALPFLLSWLKRLFPTLILLIASFIIASILDVSYYEKLNHNWLLPLSFHKIRLLQILFISLFTLGSFFLVGSLIFLISGVISGFGPLNYPILIISSSGLATQPIGIILVKGLLLTFLSLISFITTELLFMQLLKNQAYAYFASLAFIIGQAFLPETVDSLKTIVHLLPGYYSRTVQCVTGELAAISGNSQVTFQQGLKILVIYILITFIFSYILDEIHQLKRNNQNKKWKAI